MKARLFPVLCGLACGLLSAQPAEARGFWDKLFPPLPDNGGPVACVFYVNSVSGTVECIADGRIFDLKQGDKVLARGARVLTHEGAKAALVFSNQTTLYLDQNSDLRVDKFEQEPFTPNNNLLIEPSNSQMLLWIDSGQIVISTPQLLSGTRIVLETPHAGIVILNGQSGGEKAFIEVSPKQTHFAMIQGAADVSVRDASGQLGTLDSTITTGHQAFVRYTLNRNSEGGNSGAALAVSSGGDAPASGIAAPPSSSAQPSQPSGLPRGADGLHPPSGAFAVAAATGEVTWTRGGRTLALERGQTLPLPGAAIRTGPGAGATLVLSDLTDLTLAGGTTLTAVKFEQRPGGPTNYLDVEPSPIDALFVLGAGGLEVDTPQLLDATSLVFDSPHGAVKFLPVQGGGDHARIHVSAKQTELQLLSGQANATPRNPDGSLADASQLVGPGQIAVIKPTLGNGQAENAFVEPGEFRVARLAGAAAYERGGRARPLAVGDTLPAANAVVSTLPGARLTVLLSDLTSLTLDSGTEVRFDRFLEAPVAPTNSLDVEPSETALQATILAGVVDIDTPRLLPASSLVFRTPQGAVDLLTAQNGDSAVLRVDDRQTQLQLLAGLAAARSIGSDGGLVAATQTVRPGEEAVIRPILSPARRAGGVVAQAEALTRVAVAPAPAVPPGARLITTPRRAEILRIRGTAELLSADGAYREALAPGARVPVGSTLVTGPDSELYLQPYTGAIAVLKGDGRMTLEKLDFVTTEEGILVRRSVILDVAQGTLVSMIDPALRHLDSYAVRTPKGLATARGTSFTVSVSDQSSAVATTADAVSFVSTDGDSYTISAGNVTFTPAGGQPQAPIPLSQAVNLDPEFAGVIQTAVSTVSTIVQNNLGSMSAGAAANLLSQVVGVAAAAEPSDAATFASQAVAAVTSSGSSTSANVNAAAAAVTAAAVAAAPAQSSQIASAETQAAPSVASTVTAAASEASGSSGSTSGVVQATTVEVNQLTTASSATGTSNSTGGNGGGNPGSGGAGSQGGNGSGYAGNGGQGGTGGGNQGGGGNGGQGGNGSQGNAGYAGNGNGNGGNGNGGGTGGSQQTSVTVTESTTGQTGTVTTSSSTSGANAQPTAITVTQLTGGQMSQVNSDLAAAETAQSSVTFNTSTSGGGSTGGGSTSTTTTTTNNTVNVNAVPTTPQQLPVQDDM